MKNFIISLVIMLITSISMSAQTKHNYYSYMYFGDVPMGINKDGFKARMKRHGYKYKEENEKENMTRYEGKFITNNDIIIAEYSSYTKKIGKVSVITPNINYNNIVNAYTQKYGNPIYNNIDVIYITDNGQITITYDDEDIIITYFDDISYQDILNDNNEKILRVI